MLVIRDLVFGVRGGVASTFILAAVLADGMGAPSGSTLLPTFPHWAEKDSPPPRRGGVQLKPPCGACISSTVVETPCCVIKIPHTPLIACRVFAGLA